LIEPALLALAVDRGIISDEQARGLQRLAAETEAGVPARRNPPPDDENLRLVSGFGDIFVTIGLALFLGSLGYFVGVAIGDTGRWAVLAAVSWALAEFFTRRRHMALPSIALLVAFTGATFKAITLLLGATTRLHQPGYGWFVNLIGLDLGNAWQVAVAATATAGLAALHFLRFRVPVSIAAITAALVGAAIALLAAMAPRFVAEHRNDILLIGGLGVFALAMRFDMADPHRTTRRTDVAFWLHLVAAPLIVHPLVSPLVLGDKARDLGSAGLILLVFLVLGLVALVIDRRAMLVSGLTYAGIAIATFVDRSGIDDARILPATLLGLGTFVLLVSAGWQPMRRLFLSLLPGAVSRRLPHPRIVPIQPPQAT
jgi:hypothetical protein